jgi:zinc transport system substrate-binding protein
MRWIVSCAATIAATLLVSQAACASENFPKIVVTVAPLKPYVDEILHGQGEAQNLLRPGQEPHEFSLTIPQGEMLNKADIVIVPDLSISPLLKALLAKNTHVKVIELSKLEGAEPLPYEKSNPWVDAMKELPAVSSNDQHWWHEQKPKPKKSLESVAADGSDDAPKEVKKDEPPLTDPHLWLDPERMAAIAVPLANAIAEQYPASRPELLANARILTSHLRHDVVPPMREMLSKPSTTISAVGKAEIPFITYHAAYQYFLQRFHLAHTGEITQRPEETMGAATAKKMLNGAQGLHVHCVIGEQNGVMMQRIATLTNARIVLLSPEQLVERNAVDYHEWIHNDYDRLLYVTAKAFSGCL